MAYSVCVINVRQFTQYMINLGRLTQYDIYVGQFTQYVSLMLDNLLSMYH